MIKLARALGPMLAFVDAKYDGLTTEGSLALIISACLPVPCSVSAGGNIMVADLYILPMLYLLRL